MEYETIIVTKADHVATITINRPEALNSFTKRMLEEFDYLWKDISADDDVHCVVLRAAKGRAFSTGVDVKDSQTPEGKIMHDNIWTAQDPGDFLGPKANRCWKPVVCAVHGMAAGGAFYWINESDIIICSDEATFFDPHVTYGMTSALEPIGATYRMPLGDVLRMALLGNDERIGAETAKRIGLVSEVVTLERLWERADELGRQIAAKPPAATQGTVRAIWESLDQTRTGALQTGLKYCFLGNPIGTAQVDRWAIMNNAKKWEIR
ncbi:MULTISPECIES: enoyl-CoA hydratase/isomerase family protein [Sphingobium]|jgi:enoyl-CoA hydratase/carnithine racemase|uniref:enoyl-CoA hydratase/isomerase family protein n=1 Tax=Sphingobium TaxID=165695 RepID=UPI000C67DAB1|nr:MULTISPECIES: enoyl-CoA hydratase/isomerase family protein [Sphingobium]MBS48911.1 enoyl-CoA hydratase [Sphingobium sp.]MCC4256234.1 enoyl-CoA hydratase/isomerase family protein [Sphingobium lactosutens]HCW62064.1 enoyl-CoA hydratase [Sphingobium sp.]|tara:strand:+ start:4754 stop:5548 length:795 start_codon:yes stop_codon:yes gene_type:complete